MVSALDACARRDVAFGAVDSVRSWVLGRCDGKYCGCLGLWCGFERVRTAVSWLQTVRNVFLGDDWNGVWSVFWVLQRCQVFYAG